jgi:DNA-directed RNA polymerase subunit RPC12/RpoP
MIKTNKNSLSCANCGSKFSKWKKIFLIGPRRYSIRCKSCGAKNRLPEWAFLCYFILAAVFVFPTAFIQPPRTVMYIVLGIYCLVLGIITIFFIPLILKE